MVELIKPTEAIKLGNSGGLRVDRMFNGELHFAIFEMIRGRQVDRATCVIPKDNGMQLIQILCRHCGVAMEFNNKAEAP